MCAFILVCTSTLFCPLSFVFFENDRLVSTNSANVVESGLSYCPKFRQPAKSWTLAKTTHQKGT